MKSASPDDALLRKQSWNVTEWVSAMSLNGRQRPLSRLTGRLLKAPAFSSSGGEGTPLKSPLGKGGTIGTQRLVCWGP